MLIQVTHSLLKGWYGRHVDQHMPRRSQQTTTHLQYILPPNFQGLDGHDPVIEAPFPNLRTRTMCNRSVFHTEGARQDLVAWGNLTRVVREGSHDTASVTLILNWDFSFPKHLAAEGTTSLTAWIFPLNKQ